MVSPNLMVNPIFLVNRNMMILAASLFSFRFVMLAIAFLRRRYSALRNSIGPLRLAACCSG